VDGALSIHRGNTLVDENSVIHPTQLMQGEGFTEVGDLDKRIHINLELRTTGCNPARESFRRVDGALSIHHGNTVVDENSVIHPTQR
jgi:hypothetical protein